MKHLTTLFLIIITLSCMKEQLCDRCNQELILIKYNYLEHKSDTLIFNRDCSLDANQQYSYTWSKNQCSIGDCKLDWK